MTHCTRKDGVGCIKGCRPSGEDGRHSHPSQVPTCYNTCKYSFVVVHHVLYIQHAGLNITKEYRTTFCAVPAERALAS